MTAKYELKDFMNVALFVVLYYVAFFVGMCFGYIPVFMTILTLITGIFCGIPFMLFLTKARKPGLITLFGVLCGLISLVQGSGAWPLLTAVVAALIADIIAYAFKYRTSLKSIVIYAVFSLWCIGFSARLYLASFDSYRAELVESYGEEYVSQMLQNVSGVGFWGSIALSLIGGILGGLLGYAVFRKHFRKIANA